MRLPASPARAVRAVVPAGSAPVFSGASVRDPALERRLAGIYIAAVALLGIPALIGPSLALDRKELAVVVAVGLAARRPGRVRRGAASPVDRLLREASASLRSSRSTRWSTDRSGRCWHRRSPFSCSGLRRSSRPGAALLQAAFGGCGLRGGRLAPRRAPLRRRDHRTGRSDARLVGCPARTAAGWRGRDDRARSRGLRAPARRGREPPPRHRGPLSPADRSAAARHLHQLARRSGLAPVRQPSDRGAARLSGLGVDGCDVGEGASPGRARPCPCRSGLSRRDRNPVPRRVSDRPPGRNHPLGLRRGCRRGRSTTASRCRSAATSRRSPTAAGSRSSSRTGASRPTHRPPEPDAAARTPPALGEQADAVLDRRAVPRSRRLQVRQRPARSRCRRRGPGRGGGRASRRASVPRTRSAGSAATSSRSCSRRSSSRTPRSSPTGSSPRSRRSRSPAQARTSSSARASALRRAQAPGGSPPISCSTTRTWRCTRRRVRARARPLCTPSR